MWWLIYGNYFLWVNGRETVVLLDGNVAWSSKINTNKPFLFIYEVLLSFFKSKTHEKAFAYMPWTLLFYSFSPFLRAHLLAPTKYKESRFYLNFILVRLFNCLQIHWTQKERHHIAHNKLSFFIITRSPIKNIKRPG